MMTTTSTPPSACDSTHLFCWNVRGLNNPARCTTVRAFANEANASIICLQETKLLHVDHFTISGLLGPDFIDDFGFLPADGTRGGIILAASCRFFSLSDFTTLTNTISAKVTWRADGSSWQVTGVYGPQGVANKLVFIQELKDVAVTQGDRWLLRGQQEQLPA
ncbi:hypothetical protein BRADI_5g01299v3 [Brachypodium distachyon]|uniref:Endonuclease/exonuclease/phosphatase domain-containing protein n=1 Tax=Brachypodium distachyon TaxID=15368 RepID=A0A2K2CET8_BRADI|nr:hypothetical protein BRADI_5g01299v3 [Brachypodium distachyon]